MIDPIVYLSGPTASGKTAVGVALARALNAEIISMDSMSIYRKMDIGTAKPTLQEQGGIPHHLIDILDPEEEFSVADYVKAAHETIAGIRLRGKRVLFVGGTPLYLKGLLRGLFEGPPADPELRRELRLWAESGNDLHARLTAVDPEAARRLHPNDARRLIRAIEVFEKTGTPISVWQTQFEQPASEKEHLVFVLDWPTETLNRRIDLRVGQMIGAGLLEEARELFEGKLGRTASQAVGYRELFEHFRGERPLPEAVELIQTHSRQFAKRQRTWFRGLAECRQVSVEEPFEPDRVAEGIRAAIFANR